MSISHLYRFKQNARAVQAVLDTPAITGEKGMEAFRKKWNDLEPIDRAAMVGGFFKEVQSAQAGYISSERISKTLDRYEKNLQALGMYPSTRVGDFMSFANELSQDLLWMSAFEVASGVTNGSVDIVDFYSYVQVKELGPVEKIELSALGNELISRMSEKRFGTGVPVAERWLDHNGIYTMNTIVRAIQEAFITKQADFAYALIAGAVGVSTQTTTSSSITDLITAANSATDALIAANANKGFGMSPDTPILLFLRRTHKGLWDQVMRAQEVTSTHPDYTDIKLTNLVIPVYTYNTNFPTTFGGKKAGMLVLPGRKNVWANFKGLELNEERDFATSSRVVQALQYWNAQTDATQKYILNLEA